MSLDPRAQQLLAESALAAGTRFASGISGWLAEGEQASARVAELQAELVETLAKVDVDPANRAFYEGEAKVLSATIELRLVEERLLAPGTGSVALALLVDSLRAGAQAAAPIAAQLVIGALASQIGA